MDKIIQLYMDKSIAYSAMMGRRRLARARRKYGNDIDYIEYLDYCLFIIPTIIWAIVMVLVGIVVVIADDAIWGLNFGTKIYLVICVCICLYAYSVTLWYVAVRNDGIEKCSMLGIRKFISYKEITSARYIGDKKIGLFVEEKMVFETERIMDEKRLVEVLRKNKIKVHR